MSCVRWDRLVPGDVVHFRHNSYMVFALPSYIDDTFVLVRWLWLDGGLLEAEICRGGRFVTDELDVVGVDLAESADRA